MSTDCLAFLYCRQPKKCNCKKSRCLKLYCDCFAAGQYCKHTCSCQSCLNNADNKCAYHILRFVSSCWTTGRCCAFRNCQQFVGSLSCVCQQVARTILWRNRRDIVVSMRDQVRQRNPQVRFAHQTAQSSRSDTAMCVSDGMQANGVRVYCAQLQSPCCRPFRRRSRSR